MQTYVAEIDGRAIFAFRSVDITCAQAWLDIHGLMRRTLERLQSEGRAVWDGQSEILAREATSDKSVIWRKSTHQGADKDQSEEPDSFTVWLIPDPAEPQTKLSRPAPRGGRRLSA